jgi:hypothetical protein
MEVVPVDTTGLIGSITEKNSLIAFELLIILAMGLVVKTLYGRNVKLGDDQAKALMDSTVAINNNTLALSALTKEIERINDVR